MTEQNDFNTEIPELTCKKIFIDGKPCGGPMYLECGDCGAISKTEKELEHIFHSLTRELKLWKGIAFRNSGKIVAALGDGKEISKEVQAGYMHIIIALCRDWIKKAPRFMEAHFEDDEGQIIVTVRKAETPSPVELLKKVEEQNKKYKNALKEIAHNGDCEYYFDRRCGGCARCIANTALKEE